jgi:hypothetical protein
MKFGPVPVALYRQTPYDIIPDFPDKNQLK